MKALTVILLLALGATGHAGRATGRADVETTTTIEATA